MNKKILILGGTGKTGRRVAERLTQLNISISIGSRTNTPSFDWDNHASWGEVLTGINKVYITFQPDLSIPAAVPAISAFVEAAKKAGVKHLVLLSGRGEKEAEACEGIVINSGMDWTIVRASWFMQNFSEGFLLDGILQNNVVLPIVKAKEPFVDVDDIADVVTEALLNDRHLKKIYELTGPGLISFQTAISKIAGNSKRNIQYQEVFTEEYLSILKNYQVPDDLTSLISYLFTEVLDGRNESVTNDIEEILGRKASTFDNYISKTAQTGVWNNEN